MYVQNSHICYICFPFVWTIPGGNLSCVYHWHRVFSPLSPGMRYTTDLHQMSIHRLRSPSVNVSGRLCRAVAVTRLLGIWKSLAIGQSFQILSRQTLQPQRRRPLYFSRPVEATHPPKSCQDCCLLTGRDHSGCCSVHKCVFKVVPFSTRCIDSVPVQLLPVPGQWRITKKRSQKR